jgi:S1-C subfamily serine protease
MSEPLPLSPLTDLSAALASLVAKVMPGVVSIDSNRSRSSGFLWQPGLIVTADEALSEEGEFTVTLSGGETVAAQLVGRDPTTDVALLRVDRPNLPAVPLVVSAMTAGALAMAVGAENGAPIAALGVVSRAAGPWRSLRGGEIDARIELDLHLRQSAEGGLSLDATGQAIGMVVFGPRRRAIVIPSATIARVADKLKTDGRIARGYLGLGLRTVALGGSDELGAMVMSVDPQGPGVAAGIHQGDIIVAWNGEPIRHMQGLLRALGPNSVGQTVTLGLRRAGDTKQIPLTIAERPVA